MEPRITDSTLIAVGGLVGVIALLFLLITKWRWHVFIALLVPILLFAVIPGVDHSVFISAFETGFGKTIQSIAVVIVVGTILAEGLKHTGGIERITIAMIRWVGEKRMPLALTLSGWVIGIPIFSDVGYVILNPLVHAAAITSGLNMGVMSTGLIGALQLTHAMVPPTPGPLAAVALLHADMGRVIVWGCFVSIIASFFGWLYALMRGAEGLAAFWWGSARRLRRFFYAGLGRVLLATVAQLLNSLQSINQWIVFGIIGLGLVVTGLIVERKLEEIKLWREVLETWE